MKIMGLEAPDHLNDDVIIEILVRLPLISVIRFKLISKTWYVLISDHKFLVRHSLHYHIQQIQHIDHLSHGLCFGPTKSDPFVLCRYFPFEYQPDYLIFPPLPPNPLHPHPPPILKILTKDNHPLSFFPIKNNNNDDDHPMSKFSLFTLASFSNGLVIFRGHDDTSSPPDPPKHSYDNSYFLCNPILKQCIELPGINLLLFDDENDILEPPIFEYEPTILFDPTISLSYKVIRFFERPNSLFQMFVYSPTTRSSSSSSSVSAWRLVTSFHWDEDTLYTNNGVFLNGVLYSLYLLTGLIICFDVVKEIVWFIDYPPLSIGMTFSTAFFGQCSGHLQLVAQYCDPNFLPCRLSFPCSFDVFEMEHHQEQYEHNQEVIHSTLWTLKYRVKNIQPPPCYDHILTDYVILITGLYKTRRKRDDGEGEEEEEALLMKMFHMNDQDAMTFIFEFNLTSNTFGELLDIPFGYYLDTHEQYMFPYTMTLFPLSSPSAPASSSS